MKNVEASLNKVSAATPGWRLRRERLRRSWSQMDLAAEAGISRSHVTHMELNRDPGGLSAWQALAEAFGLPIGYLLNGDGSIEAGEPDEKLVKDAEEIVVLGIWRALGKEQKAFALGGMRALLRTLEASKINDASAHNPSPTVEHKENMRRRRGGVES